MFQVEVFVVLCIVVFQDDIELELVIFEFDIVVQKMFVELFKCELEMLQCKMEVGYVGDDDKECMCWFVGEISCC